MQKTILALLITLLVTTPYLAQEVKAEEPVSLHGTQWEFTTLYENIPGDDLFSFYSNRVYLFCRDKGVCSEAPKPNIYVRLMGLSFFRAGHRTLEINRDGPCEDTDLYVGIMSPLSGKGVMYHEYGCFLSRERSLATIEKFSDNWEPPEDVVE